MKTLSEHRCFGGTQGFYQHDSATIGLPMRFSVFVPPQASHEKCPLLIYLAGLTCTEENFPIKAHAQKIAAELGWILACPDTSPRNTGIAGEADAWDLGAGAGFYVDATQAPWNAFFKMESYVMHDWLPYLQAQFPCSAHVAIMGHSMGGHGALTLACKYPGVFKSLSVLAPVSAPSQAGTGTKVFKAYLGEEPSEWLKHDACHLIAQQKPAFDTILVSQGLEDNFLKAGNLRTDLLVAACKQAGQELIYEEHAGYDHGYYFVQSMMEQHVRFHEGYR